MSEINNTDLHKRYQTNETAFLRVRGYLENLMCVMENVSLTGAKLRVSNTSYLPKTQEKVKVTLHLRSINKTHRIYAQVVWVKGLDIGLKFIAPGEAGFI